MRTLAENCFCENDRLCQKIYFDANIASLSLRK